jgi:heat shock protein HslJ
MRLRLLTLPLLLLLLAACGTRTTAQDAPDPLRGQTFLATAVTEDGKPHALVPGTEMTVEFTDDGRLIAQAGCNMMQGQVDTSNGTLAVELETTAMGCDDARHEQDSFVAKVLGASPTWKLTDDRLTITSGSTRFDLAPRDTVQPEKALVGTTWALDTLVDGEVASSMAAGSQEVTLVFDDKQVVADTHCNGVSAEYTIEGDTIEFTPGASTKMACAPEIMQGENAVSEVLQGEVTYEITADKLTLTNSSGKGIQLHAK